MQKANHALQLLGQEAVVTDPDLQQMYKEMFEPWPDVKSVTARP